MSLQKYKLGSLSEKIENRELEKELEKKLASKVEAPKVEQVKQKPKWKKII